jgi:hypothetical protein
MSKNIKREELKLYVVFAFFILLNGAEGPGGVCCPLVPHLLFSAAFI